jgi:CO/xanthine dehydrogenase FAD-binding subunit
MDAPVNKVFYPVSFSELFSTWNHFPNAVPFAGGTDFTWRQGKSVLELPEVILCLDNLDELHHVKRTEQYFEIGAMVKLNKIIRLGKTVPQILCDCIKKIASLQLRNIATIGGNICCPTRLLDMPAALTALDAQYELRSANSSRWVSASRFHSSEDIAVLNKQELLTRVRLPLYKWDFSMYKKFYSEDKLSSKTLIFMAKTQKNILSDLRVVFKANTIIKNKSGEGILIGKHLPLNRKAVVDYIDSWDSFLENNDQVDGLSRHELINCIEETVFNLTD